jgi:CHAD domain-containing protein
MKGMKLARKKIEGLESQMPAVDAAHITISQRFAAVESLLPMAALRVGEDEEYVHQLRVASRRADAALRAFEPFLKGKAYRQARKGLTKIRRTAGDARACDVHMRMLRALAKSPIVNGAISARMTEHRQTAIGQLVAAAQAGRYEAQSAVKKVAEKYHGKKLSTLQNALLESLGPVNLERDGDGAQAMTLDELARQRLSRFARHVRRLAVEIAEAELSIGRLHALRIRAKRLRYAMELFAPCYADGLKSAYQRVEAMQNELGEINDLDDLAARLDGALSGSFDASSRQGSVTFTLEEHAVIDALRQQLLTDRDARAERFLGVLRDGEWNDVINFETRIAEAPPGCGRATSEARAPEVRG